MKILFTRFPLESSFGGAEVQTLSLMKGLSERGHAVAFMGSCPILLKKCLTEGIPTVELQIGPPPVTKWQALSFFWRKAKMQRQLINTLSALQATSYSSSPSLGAEGKLQAIFMLSLSEKLLLTEAAVEKGIPVFWIEHDRVGPWLSKNPWLPRLLNLSKNVTTIVVSELSKKMYEELGFANVVAIPNGVDMSRFQALSPAPLSLQGEGMGVRAGCIARLTPDKGVDLLIEAVKDLPNVTLTIVGKGREEKYLQKLIETVKNTKPLTMNHQPTNLVPSVPDLADFYRSLDILVLPSREHDPFGMVAAEAMMLGIPVIVTDACGIAGYLKNGEDAIIVNANSSHALVEGMKQLTDAAMRKRIGEAGKETALKKFALPAMVERYEELLTESSLPGGGVARHGG